jgi:phosphate-selective porin OprO/OprP
VAVSYFVTGEANGFKAVTPKRPFALSGGGWGALELTARIQQLDVDDDLFPLYANPGASATEASSWGVGANWHLNRNIKFSLNYEDTNFKGGSATPFLANGEKVVLGRIQFSF